MYKVETDNLLERREFLMLMGKSDKETVLSEEISYKKY